MKNNPQWFCLKGNMLKRQHFHLSEVEGGITLFQLCLQARNSSINKYINNDTRERKSCNLVGKKFWHRVNWRKEKFPTWYINVCMSLKLLIHDELLGRSVVTNPSPRATQPPPSWRWIRWRCRGSWTGRVCPPRKAANWTRHSPLWLRTRRTGA